MTNEKVVGYFKGRVKVSNAEEQKEFNAAKEQKMNDIFDHIGKGRKDQTTHWLFWFGCSIALPMCTPCR